ncbi:MAG TPA: class I SAM-dependent methyltransferase [Gaiellaceae bacterium]|nr:class I SAM-dependent methyltransferase [Gaiellaceae bacterium]
MATDAAATARDALAERLFGAALGAYEVLTVHLGDRLGLYRALAAGAATPAEVAAAAGVADRYAREWLEQQAVAGILGVEDVTAPEDERRYSLPPGHADVLIDPDSPAYTTPMARFAASFASVLPALEDAYRSGDGVPWEAFGPVGRHAQAEANRPIFGHLVGAEWLPAIADVHERLLADPPARVADVACGAGWSSIAVARAYPEVRVDGFDLDAEAIEMARGHAAEAGVDDRVTFHAREGGAAEPAEPYDLVTVFEAIHDLPRPVEVLASMRRLAGAEGAVLVVDERVADTFTAPGDEVERLMYTYSVLCCLPVGLSETPSAATGTVMRTDTLRRYAREAGFSHVEVLPIEHEVFRLYRLRS